MAGEKISVFIADDHQIVVEGIAAMIAKDPSIEVVGYCNDGLKVLDMVQSTQPDVLVLDISLPGLNGLDVCCLVKARVPNISILMFSMNSNERFITYAFENGASGYLTKDRGGVEFCDAIHSIIRGELYLGQGLRRGLLSEISRKHRDPEGLLSERERRILQLLAEGLSDQQIAEAVNIPCQEIQNDYHSLMQKLDLDSQVDLVKHAIRFTAA